VPSSPRCWAALPVLPYFFSFFFGGSCCCSCCSCCCCSSCWGCCSCCCCNYYHRRQRSEVRIRRRNAGRVLQPLPSSLMTMMLTIEARGRTRSLRAVRMMMTRKGADAQGHDSNRTRSRARARARCLLSFAAFRLPCRTRGKGGGFVVRSSYSSIKLDQRRVFWMAVSMRERVFGTHK
jgi:hypothetical protein